MKHVQKSVLLWYSPPEMYALVTDVSRYPEFLPWCDRAEVLAQDDDSVTARLGLSIGGIRQTFTTRNTHKPDSQVKLSLVEGPFSSLHGLWVFRPLGKPDDPVKACKVEFDMRYAFASATLQTVVSPVFDRVADTLVEAFVGRARDVYGER